MEGCVGLCMGRYDATCSCVCYNHLLRYTAVVDCFPHLCFLSIGHVLFNFQSAVQGHSENAGNICGMSRMS